jgi:choline kinase
MFTYEDVILANADVYWEKSTLDLLCAAEHEATVLGDEERIELGDYFFQTKNGYLVKYGKDLKQSERSCEYVGISKLKKTFIPQFVKQLESLIDAEQYHLWWENVLYENCSRYPVYVQNVGNFFWGEIDYLQDYYRIRNYVTGKDGKSL